MAPRFPVVLEPEEWDLFQRPGSVEILRAHGRSTSPDLTDAQIICLIPHLAPFLLRKRIVEMIGAGWLDTSFPLSLDLHMEAYEKSVYRRKSSLLPRGARLADVAIKLVEASPDAKPVELIQEPGREIRDNIKDPYFVFQQYDLPLEFSIDRHFSNLLEKLSEEEIRASLREIRENLIAREPERQIRKDPGRWARSVARLRNLPGLVRPNRERI